MRALCGFSSLVVAVIALGPHTRDCSKKTKKLFYIFKETTTKSGAFECVSVKI